MVNFGVTITNKHFTFHSGSLLFILIVAIFVGYLVHQREKILTYGEERAKEEIQLSCARKLTNGSKEFLEKVRNNRDEPSAELEEASKHYERKLKGCKDFKLQGISTSCPLCIRNYLYANVEYGPTFPFEEEKKRYLVVHGSLLFDNWYLWSYEY